jgi:hypothetical protein
MSVRDVEVAISVNLMQGAQVAYCDQSLSKCFAGGGAADSSLMTESPPVTLLILFRSDGYRFNKRKNEILLDDSSKLRLGIDS